MKLIEQLQFEELAFLFVDWKSWGKSAILNWILIALFGTVAQRNVQQNPGTDVLCWALLKNKELESEEKQLKTTGEGNKGEVASSFTWPSFRWRHILTTESQMCKHEFQVSQPSSMRTDATDIYPVQVGRFAGRMQRQTKVLCFTQLLCALQRRLFHSTELWDWFRGSNSHVLEFQGVKRSNTSQVSRPANRKLKTNRSEPAVIRDAQSPTQNGHRSPQFGRKSPRSPAGGVLQRHGAQQQVTQPRPPTRSPQQCDSPTGVKHGRKTSTPSKTPPPPLGNSPGNFAGARYYDPPSPKMLPKPPTEWMLTNKENDGEAAIVIEDRSCTQMTSAIRVMLNVQAWLNYKCSSISIVALMEHCIPFAVIHSSWVISSHWGSHSAYCQLITCRLVLLRFTERYNLSQLLMFICFWCFECLCRHRRDGLTQLFSLLQSWGINTSINLWNFTVRCFWDEIFKFWWLSGSCICEIEAWKRLGCVILQWKLTEVCKN